jgi:hypothetical protein
LVILVKLLVCKLLFKSRSNTRTMEGGLKGKQDKDIEEWEKKVVDRRKREE